MYALHTHDHGTPAADGQPVTLFIDGAEVTVPAGTSVMRAAAAAGGAIPKLCATDTLQAFGSCRVCLVEIEGQKGFPASCTTLVAPGMKVKTESDRLSKLRRAWSSCTCRIILKRTMRAIAASCARWPASWA